MRKLTVPRLTKWPFFLGDALLLALTFFICSRSQSPMGHLEMFACFLCVGLGAVLAIVPFHLEYRAATELLETEGLASAVSRIKNLEQLSAQIGYATSQWQIVRESADKTANAAKELAQGMATEIKGFEDFIQRSNEGEKATLRLEVEKLRRSEVEWLQVLVRILDHTFALHQAALRSRQAGVAEQIGNFQNACRDAARRIGLMPFAALPNEKFDGQRFQVVDGAKPSAETEVEETVAAGYTFQGKMLRPALVRTKGSQAAPSAPPENPAENANQNQLPLESAK
jgi:molecular chaperone GrpE (heat shock protein)